MQRSRAPLSFLRKRTGVAFRVRRIVVPAGGERGYEQGEWRDALVVVERGSVEIETIDGASCSFVKGDILRLTGLRLRLLRNRGRLPVVLSVASRRDPTWR
jgi:CRP-like cAMP-binding protein